MIAIKHLSILFPLPFIKSGLGVIFGLAGIAFLIGFHELGHFLFAKLFKVHTPSFSIGFGPKIISKKIGETQFSLSAIPLGGYVEMAGMADETTSDIPQSRLFSHKPFYQKFLIMSGGILFNLIFAYIAFILLFAAGLPASDYLYPLNATNKVRAVLQDSPVAKTLQEGDIILSFNGIPAEHNILELYTTAAKQADRPIDLSIKRGDEILTTSLIPALRNGHGSLDVLFTSEALAPMPFFQACKEGFHLANSIISRTIRSLLHIMTKRDVSSMGGPLSIISEAAKSSSLGILPFMILLCIISINLAVLNIIPLPILDGGQILVYAVEAIIGRPLPIRAREYLFLGTWAIMLTLFIYLTYKDIIRLASAFLKRS